MLIIFIKYRETHSFKIIYTVEEIFIQEYAIVSEKKIFSFNLYERTICRDVIYKCVVRLKNPVGKFEIENQKLFIMLTCHK